jgi:acetyl-CoA/propionyl-CoA carboxylase, biotin carboxylase, biotin carboxyl carrier protein
MRKVLIANRGEIAVRIARACRDYGLKSVAVYADVDADAVFVALADEAYGLFGQRPAETYLNIGKIIDVARRSGADAVHPGYGFLSERADFAQAVIDAGLTWIGPHPDVIEKLGDKVEARRIAERVGAPLVPGSSGPVAGVNEVLEFARTHGFPIAIKAAFGGGGRGLKVARTLEETPELFDSAVREAIAAFGRGECFVESFLDRPRHIEAQILADQHQNVVVVGTRDCTLQRRNQKLVEEAPAPFLTAEQRSQIHDAARAICSAAGYVGAGTVEFLLGANGLISFLEVNTRLQVEHPVTEETTGIDLVIEQFRIAEGRPLSFDHTPEPRGHAIEFRINAEDPGRGFLPTPGRITRFDPPSGPGIRLDSGVVTGSVVPGTFDSLVAKLIVTGRTREEALARASRALNEFHIEGVATVLPFHRAAISAEAFTGETGFAVHTRWIETDFDGFPLPGARGQRFDDAPMLRSFVEVDGRRCEIALPQAFFSKLGLSTAQQSSEGDKTPIAPAQTDLLLASISGSLQAWQVADGAVVAEGDIVAVMEAMKMETRIEAHQSGVIHFAADEGTFLEAGTPIARIESK